MFSSNTSQVADGGYQISRSLRFNSADSANLTRTFSSINSRTFTYSLWLKRGKIGTRQDVLQGTLIFVASDILAVGFVSGGDILDTTQVFRDPSAWYHIVVAMDTTQATASNRLKLYVNGQQVTAFSYTNYPAQNSTTDLSANGIIGYGSYGSSQYFDGYLADVYFVEGQQLTPSSFGETNAQTGVWQPKAYAGSYGTNGFYLNFSDNSNTTAATLGKDYSGNGNNWTPNNFSVAAGAGNDSLVDTPTPYGSGNAGGDVRGNYCTLNPLIQRWLIPTATFSNGNLDTANTNASNGYVFGTTSVTSGKFYWEVTVTAVGSSAASFSIGVDSGALQFSTFPDFVAYGGDGNKYVGSVTPSAYGASYTTNDIIGVALDKDAGTVTFYKNGASQGAINLPTNVAMVSYCSPGVTSGSATFNFGQRPFAYTAPSGFKALCTQNLPTPTIGATTATQAGKYFDVVLRNGGGSSGGTYSTTVNMSNGALVWDKPRNQASSNYLVDSVRGISKNLRSNLTDAEATDASWFTNFGSSSFTTGSSDWGTGTTVVDWIWAANGSGSTNTAGSITSTVSANTTAGFSVVTYTGTGANATIGHGLGVAPRMIIVKQRNGVNIWPVYHENIGNTQYLRLQGNNPAGTFNVWQNTSPTSSVFYISTDSTVNTNTGTYVAYCFAEVAGYSSIRSYVGNGSTDGPFVFTGFRPKFLLIKSSTLSASWTIEDGSRSPSNVVSNILYPDLSNAEDVGAVVDFLSNGFKVRTLSDTYNNNGNTYVYAAFAENPFKYSLAR